MVQADFGLEFPSHSSDIVGIVICFEHPIACSMLVDCGGEDIGHHDPIASGADPSKFMDLPVATVETVYKCKGVGATVDKIVDVFGGDVVGRMDEKINFSVGATGASGREDACAGIQWVAVAVDILGGDNRCGAPDIGRGGVVLPKSMRSTDVDKAAAVGVGTDRSVKEVVGG
jgi:hypothetical protein